MHADAFYRQPDDREGGLAGPLALAIGLHVLVAVLFWVAWWWSPQRQVEPAAGSPVIEASLVMSPADVAAAQRRAEEAPKPEPEPLPEPVTEPAPEETVPPPQPEPEPRPQDAVVAPQQQAQEFIPEPDTVDQDAARRDAIAREKAEKEQEERRRQEQVDLTEEREKQKAAENQRRLAAQAEDDKQKKLAELRRQREQAARQVALAEQKVRQLEQVQQRQSAPPTPPSQGTPGQGGTSEDLTAKYAAAIQQAVLNQWIRPDTVPLGQRCRVSIRQIPGGEVIDVEIQPGCPFDEAGRRSLEAAVLRAKPLPYRGFESAFQRNLTLNFEAQDR
ncbi:cell envelope integrity protein TolA [Pseudoxanthomonas daejeonensis]|uniref:cell envelope integrity protein TolA n=1 Tax=Pseudoxanthomonas daejeonensis TaxID=266062 RepID=UPI001F547698|nr:cell envelope integrity protein TolA [Pseudoxanthomonas daejeonensis]UNK56537.1 cell envelope integrity protein TolA [Pseudoxanthomonas daejeonensis]